MPFPFDPPIVTSSEFHGLLLFPEEPPLFENFESPLLSYSLANRGRSVGRQALTTALACSITAQVNGSVSVPIESTLLVANHRMCIVNVETPTYKFH